MSVFSNVLFGFWFKWWDIFWNIVLLVTGNSRLDSSQIQPTPVVEHLQCADYIFIYMNPTKSMWWVLLMCMNTPLEVAGKLNSESVVFFTTANLTRHFKSSAHLCFFSIQIVLKNPNVLDTQWIQWHVWGDRCVCIHSYIPHPGCVGLLVWWLKGNVVKSVWIAFKNNPFEIGNVLLGLVFFFSFF